jgi:type IV pilus assembly protein PilV
MTRQHPPRCRHGRRAGQQGVTLIEVLVTMVVIALGLLGHARLLTTTINHGNSAYMRSVATMLAYDITESMRANRPAALAGSYTTGFDDSATGGTPAGNDLVYWKNQLSTLLPAGKGQVAVNGQRATIQIQWKDARDGTSFQFDTQTDL